ncbi:MAG TPA: transaldolase family protein, partial [Acidimicrobiales bacterium]|nr:transaldolase family protein [Acidimicrobiales bacterium]
MSTDNPGMAARDFKSPLYEMTQTTPTCLWNDSASVPELLYAIDNGAVGATCNPVIALTVVRQELSKWVPRLREMVDENPGATEDQLGWRLVEEVSQSAAAFLAPVFEAEKGRNGRLSIQTDPRYYRDTRSILRQAERFSRLADNMIVKIPATSAGIPAIEEATYQGISTNATVSFTVPQAVQVAEAVERGL